MSKKKNKKKLYAYIKVPFQLRIADLLRRCIQHTLRGKNRNKKEMFSFHLNLFNAFETNSEKTELNFITEFKTKLSIVNEKL